MLDNVQVTAAIASGEVDLGIMLNPRTSRELAVRAHAQIQLGLVTPPKHSLARQRSVRFSVCAEQPIVAPAEPLALCEQIRGLEVATGVTLNTVATSDNIHMIKSLITHGLGLGVLTWLDVADEVQRGELAFIPLAHASLQPLTLAVCIDPARQLSAAARLFLGWVETALTEFGSAPRPLAKRANAKGRSDRCGPACLDYGTAVVMPQLRANSRCIRPYTSVHVEPLAGCSGRPSYAQISDHSGLGPDRRLCFCAERELQ